MRRNGASVTGLLRLMEYRERPRSLLALATKQREDARRNMPYCLCCDDTGYVMDHGAEKPCPWCNGNDKSYVYVPF